MANTFVAPVSITPLTVTPRKRMRAMRYKKKIQWYKKAKKRKAKKELPSVKEFRKAHKNRRYHKPYGVCHKRIRNFLLGYHKAKKAATG